MKYLDEIQNKLIEIIKESYNAEISKDTLVLSETRKEFDGDYTLVVFPLVKKLKKNPAEIAERLGEALVDKMEHIEAFNVIKGFLNLSFSNDFWMDTFSSLKEDKLTFFDKKNKKFLIEFSSPNTNKPLHLGHVRNILLGWSASKIVERTGIEVIKTQIINDRGIAISKSMLAWKKIGNGKTPTDANIKADHFVGDYYVKFEQLFQEEYKSWQQKDEAEQVYESSKQKEQSKEAFFKKYKNQYFNEFSELGAEAKSMLQAWEKEDVDTRRLWEKMNTWVYEGFDLTYADLGVTFDSLYYESDTYKLGKSLIEDGLKKGIFYQKEDNSIWIDLTDEGLDHKLVLRSDGTSVYMTQDIGTAHKRYEDTGANGMIYVVADEQDYHFKALFAILRKIGEPYAKYLHHLNYGMVDLPTGRMKSREGTVVDADDLMREVTEVARKNAVERGELTDVTDKEREETYRKIGMAALKFFILKVNPKKRMIFNPEESVDMQGTTGPYIQYAYVRLESILEKAKDIDLNATVKDYETLQSSELIIIKMLKNYQRIIQQAADELDPSLLAMYAYELAKASHKFIHDVRILNAESDQAKLFRLKLGKQITITLKDAFSLLGIEMPEKM